MLIVVPSPSCDWKLISPPCAATIVWTMARPRPIPKAGIGGSPRFAARTPIGIFERVPGLRRMAAPPPKRLGTRALLVAQHLAGVEAGGAARGKERGGAADGGEKRRGGREGERVGGPDTEEDGLHGASPGQRGGEADCEAERDEQKRIAQDHPHHLRARGAERASGVDDPDRKSTRL